MSSISAFGLLVHLVILQAEVENRLDLFKNLSTVSLTERNLQAEPQLEGKRQEMLYKVPVDIVLSYRQMFLLV